MMLRHIAFRRETRLDLTVEGCVVLAGDGESAHYMDVARIITSEGIDLNGLLPTEEMVALKDELLAQAQMDAEKEFLAKMLPRTDLLK